MMLSAKTRKILITVGALLAVLYTGFGGFILWAMRQPPETFGRVMARLPGPVPFLIFPFETAWIHSRAGSLQVGDPAPDFSLLKLDKSETVQLSALTSKQPVALVFGSYT